jgi:3-methyladenine DNA glycosylase/8-oxoguanine DNA glycosylase
VAMRALRRPDALPAGDLGLLKAARLKSAKALEKTAAPWRPWRAYGAMHLWESLAASNQSQTPPVIQNTPRTRRSDP